MNFLTQISLRTHISSIMDLSELSQALNRPQTPPEPRKGTPHLTRDERNAILLMHSLGYSEDLITSHLSNRYGKKISIRQIAYTIHMDKGTPRKHTGRPPVITREQADELEAFVTSSRATRRMTYKNLADHFRWEEIGPYAIQLALQKRGYHRRIALRKPPLSVASKAIRLQWAHEHRYWTEDQWWKILWSDETWVHGGTHRKTWVTRKAGEELNTTCLVDKEQRRAGWMFWGCFSGSTKGPHCFWEKDWGTIGSATYCAHILPLIHGWLTWFPSLVLMQDNAPGHSARATLDEMTERGIYPIFWPAFSPDLNPIETIWNRMKDWLAKHYPEKMSYDQLRVAVKAAWEAIPDEEMADLVREMGERCQAVIDAQGGHIPY